MDRHQILSLLTELGEHLARKGIRGEMLVFGGTAMALAFDALRRTRDVDAIFEPKSTIYEIAARMAEERGLPPNWLNDSVKGFVAFAPESERVVLDVAGLIVRVPPPDYLFAMKALAGRPEDLEDVRLLIRHLGVQSLDEALEIVERYYPRHRIPAKTRFFLEDVLGSRLER